MGVVSFFSDERPRRGPEPGTLGLGPTGIVDLRAEAAPPNPNPDNFVIERLHRDGGYVCALVHYPGCTTFEGRKIVVFEDSSEDEVTDLKRLDPHFSEDGNIVARFRADDEGWQDALAYADSKAGGFGNEAPGV